MTFHNFLLSLGVGSALIAFWCVFRFPNLVPKDFGRALLHVCAALLLGAITPNVVGVVSSFNYASFLVAMFAVLLPVLIYTFLSGAWVLKLAHDAISHYRH